jgi:maltose/moltooligosaccharide transporter
MSKKVSNRPDILDAEAQIASSSTPSVNRPNLTFWQIWNMSFGFFGLQYSFGLQQFIMSPVFRYLNAEEDKLPILWLAGPVTGLLVQPIIGALSDKTWSPRWGRRKPFFMIGAIITTVALILMPHSKTLWMAASLMWLLDAGLNVTMEPFRAFIGDKLNDSQRTLGFAVQSFFVGFGQILASLMPKYILPAFGIAVTAAATSGGSIPDYVHYLFYFGAFAILVSVFVTVTTTDEYPPENMEAFKKEASKGFNLRHMFAEVGQALREMPTVMRQLWWVKFFTWYGLPLMWQYFSLAVARHAFNAPSKDHAGFEEGTAYGAFCFTFFNVGCILVSLLIPILSKKLNHQMIHAILLTVGGLGFIYTLTSPDSTTFAIAMLLVGFAWGSILSMPYVMLASSVPPQRMGVYMGIFNGFIVVPQIINMITVPLYYKSLLGDDPRNALVLAGICLILAAASCFLVKTPKENNNNTTFIGGGGGH